VGNPKEKESAPASYTSTTHSEGTPASYTPTAREEITQEEITSKIKTHRQVSLWQKEIAQEIT
jgi:hypothetical protein